MTEAEAKAELTAAGLPVPQGITADSPDAAARAAEKLGFPVVLKGLGVAHKTEAGAVILNLADADAVRQAAVRMAGVATGFLVERMVARPVAELIIGALRDPVAGPVLTIGAGGILVELLEDSALLTLPTDSEPSAQPLPGSRSRACSPATGADRAATCRRSSPLSRLRPAMSLPTPPISTNSISIPSWCCPKARVSSPPTP